LTLATFALVIGVLVFVHEMGHYLVARLFGIGAEAFSIGFGREIAGWTDSRGTRWKVGVLPLGGYVKFAGDADASSRPDDAREATPAERAVMFQFRPMWQRALVILAGPLTNFLFAIVIFAGFFTIYGQSVTPPVVAQVVVGSPASRGGLLPGDRIRTLDGTSVDTFEELVAIVTANAGTAVVATVERDGATRNVTVRPAIIDRVDEFGSHYHVGQLGIVAGRRIVVARSLPAAVVAAVREVGVLIGAIGRGLGQIVGGHRAASELGGPIKIAQISGQAAALGLPSLVQFIAFVSINLGFINLLPVPMLDGGHLFLYAVEAVRRRPLAPKVQEWAFMSGFAALMSLMVFLTWNDLGNIGAWHRLSGLFG
jgi:regulator of sigma E protease